jgi:outer membrane protein assembly factor BamD
MYRKSISVAALLGLCACGTTVASGGMSREEMIQAAAGRFEQGQWSRASLLYTELQFRFPGDELYDLFLFRGALCNREMRLWADAEFGLYRVVNEFPRGAWADDAQLALAQTLWMQRRDHRRDPAPVIRAREEIELFLDRYPGSDLREQAESLLSGIDDHLALRALDTGRFYLRRDRPEAAILYLREALDSYPEASSRGRIMLTIGDAYLAQGNDYSARSYYRRAVDEGALTPEELLRVEEILSEGR